VREIARGQAASFKEIEQPLDQRDKSKTFLRALRRERRFSCLRSATAHRYERYLCRTLAAKTAKQSREDSLSNFARLQRVLLGSASIVAIVATVAPVFAQDTGAMETVVVTGRRAAIESAAKIKENADQIVDAVVADDAGKLPDNSITEVLQRVSGVSITHFGAPNDPDHPSVEGSGVAVRGMTQVNSTLNGREAFSANGGRALLWEDVPPELMAAVNVFKSSTADQLEGGVGGSVDLRTHMPFDFDGFTARGSVGVNYGDFVKQGRPTLRPC
jgi:iron complex outermembrane recepter protein